MRDNEIAQFTVPALIGIAVSAVMGWFLCSFVGGSIFDNVKSGFEFGLVGLVLGLWIGYHEFSRSSIPTWIMVGATVEVIWFLSLGPISQVLRRGATSVRDMFLNTDSFVAPDNLSWIDAWWINLIVGVLGLAIIVYGYSQENEMY